MSASTTECESKSKSNENSYDFRIAPRMHRLIQLMMEWRNHLEHKEYVSSLVYLRFNPPIASIGVLGESKIMWGANSSRHDRESLAALLSLRPLDLPGLVLISIQILIHNGLFWKGKVSISLSIVLSTIPLPTSLLLCHSVPISFELPSYSYFFL